MKPILFNTEMVRAILEGRKTCTRRVVKPQPPDMAELTTNPPHLCAYDDSTVDYGHDGRRVYMKPYLQGDILYVRETWQCTKNGFYIFRSDKYERGSAAYYNEYGRANGGWHPSIHMPKEAARIFLRVTDVRVERLWGMEIEEFKREGIERRELSRKGCSCEWEMEGCKENPCGNRDAYELDCYMDPFIEMWNSTIKKSDLSTYGWEANPWVWVIEFERCEKPEEDETI